MSYRAIALVVIATLLISIGLYSIPTMFYGQTGLTPLQFYQQSPVAPLNAEFNATVWQNQTSLFVLLNSTDHAEFWTHSYILHFYGVPEGQAKYPQGVPQSVYANMTAIWSFGDQVAIDYPLYPYLYVYGLEILIEVSLCCSPTLHSAPTVLAEFLSSVPEGNNITLG